MKRLFQNGVAGKAHTPNDRTTPLFEGVADMGLPAEFNGRAPASGLPYAAKSPPRIFHSHTGVFFG
jgi:hypothetical protein